ncbi:MAG: histidine triad nucleotide-binding protein [Oscillospiraceae bacterium]|jgi:histidine triad (HIT) family protein|nr:histidine triad nucleotide-binding protein [Oscillospiraceae bacterium]
MADCLFCKIVAGEIPSTKVYEDATVLAFRDVAPQAPTHILVVPKTHVDSLDAVTIENAAIAGWCLQAIPKIAKLEGLTNGYRVISNVGEDGGQTVPHLHFHIIGGKKLSNHGGF